MTMFGRGDHRSDHDAEREDFAPDDFGRDEFGYGAAAPEYGDARAYYAEGGYAQRAGAHHAADPGEGYHESAYAPGYSEPQYRPEPLSEQPGGRHGRHGRPDPEPVVPGYPGDHPHPGAPGGRAPSGEYRRNGFPPNGFSHGDALGDAALPDPRDVEDTGPIPRIPAGPPPGRPAPGGTGAIPRTPAGPLPGGSGPIPRRPGGPPTGSVPRLPGGPAGPGTGAVPRIPPGPGTGAMPRVPGGPATGSVPRLPGEPVGPNTGSVPRIPPGTMPGGPATGSVPRLPGGPGPYRPAPEDGGTVPRIPVARRAPAGPPPAGPIPPRRPDDAPGGGVLGGRPGPQPQAPGDLGYGRPPMGGPATGRHRPVDAEPEGVYGTAGDDYPDTALPATAGVAAPDPYRGNPAYHNGRGARPGAGPGTGGFAAAEAYPEPAPYDEPGPHPGDHEYGYVAEQAYGGEAYADDGYADDPVYDPEEAESAGFAPAEFDDDEGYAVDDEYDDVDEEAEPQTGPFDYDEVADILDRISEQRLDLGSIILPVPDGGQLQVEMTPDGTPQAVHLATPHGRLTVAAYAAPKSPGQWRTVAADLAESLRADGAQVSVQTGPWGRELHAVTEGADLRFIGVDGYRWMVRLVAAGPSGAADEGTPLVEAARAILADTVVRRGEEPMPVREPLPVVLPQELADQLIAAHQQQIEAQQQALAAQAAAAEAAATGTFSVVTADQQVPRRGAEGSAMQQLGLN